MRSFEVRELGKIGYAEASALQQNLADRRKRGLITDQLLIVEHPHVITLGRNGRLDNLLAQPEVLQRAGIGFFPTDRGGDITYHGPGQIVGYPIVDLREWKRDVVGYVRAVEQAIIDALAEFGIDGHRVPGATGVWVAASPTVPAGYGGSAISAAVGQALSPAIGRQPAKIAAIGVHISRWVTSHGFALNHTTDLSYFQYIVPCGLTKPVTSMRALGVNVPRHAVVTALVRHFQKQFQYERVVSEDDDCVLSEDALAMATAEQEKNQ